MAARRGFGQIKRLPSGRFQASYITPDTRRRNAPSTFRIKKEAEAWLADEHHKITTGQWRQAETEATQRRAEMTIADYAEEWLEYRMTRTPGLKPSTVALYRSQLDRIVLPTIGDRRMLGLRAADVKEWHKTLGSKAPTQRAQAYALLKQICKYAVDDDDSGVTVNVCKIEGAGRLPSRTRPLTLLHIEDAGALTDMAAELPAGLALMPQLAFWMGLRFGELTELRRKDVDLDAGMITVARGVTWIWAKGQPGRFVVGTPKSAAGVRELTIPPHLLPAVAAHLAEHVRFGGKEALLFHNTSGPAEHLAQASWARTWDKITTAAGRPGLSIHDLRHAHATMYTELGATTKEVMAQLGHSDPAAALRYQHASQRRASILARRLSGLPDTPTDDTPANRVKPA